MALESNIPRDIQESIRDAIGRKTKLSLKRMVKLEIKPDKWENKVLAFASCRLYILAAKVSTKIEHSVHYLDIQAIESKKPNQWTLTVDGKKLNLMTLESDTEEVDHMITHIGTSLKQIFPAVPFERVMKTINVTPPERIKTMYEMMKDIEGRDLGPCGGFSQMYQCVCNQQGLPYREEVAWDVDTIYLSQNSKELNLSDFDHLDPRDLVPIIGGLEHNTWFTKLNATNVRLTTEAANEILKVMRRNTSVEELWLSGTGVKWEFAHKLSMALLHNSDSSLTTLDLSNNYLEDRGVSHVCGPVSKLSKGLVYLNLARTGITAKGVNRLAEALCSNKFIPTTLQFLDLSDNALKGEEITNLHNFLAQPNNLTTLKLAGTDCALDVLCGALLRGCCPNLRHLDLSRNLFTHKRGKDVIVPPSWKQFFASAMALSHLNLSGNRLPPEAVKFLMLGIASNLQVKDLHLDLSSNDLRSPGSQVLESCIADIKTITSLDVSDNGFDLDTASLAGWVSRNTVIKKLYIGRNFNNIKPKHLDQVLDSVVQMIQEENSPIEYLSIADSRLKDNTAIIINALGSNTSLTAVDVSGNHMGDVGARILSKALQINSKLHTIYWDRNNTTSQGFQDIAKALEKNHTVKTMPTPINDAANALKLNQEQTEQALEKIESLLQRNHSPRKFASDQAYRLQHGFLLSSTQQMVDRLVVQLQDLMNALNRGELGLDTKMDIDRAASLVKDADNSKQLLPRLQEVALKSEDKGNIVDMKIKTISQDLKHVLEQQLKRNVTDMVKCVEDLCPAIMSEEGFKEEVKAQCVERSVLPSDFTQALLVDQVGTEVMNKISELNVTVASHVSDRLIDSVLESLSTSHKTLTNHLNAQKTVARNKEVDNRSEKIENENEKENRVLQTRDKDSGKEKQSPGSSPKMSVKRKSLYNRRLRPQSVIESVDDFDIGANKKGNKNAIPKSQTLPDLDLPPATEVEAPKLEHLNKFRPKRTKTRAASRPMVQSAQVISNMDDGVEAFFDRRQAVSERKPSLSTPSTPSSENALERVDKDDGKKKKGWSPFGNKEKSSGLTTGISNFFSRKPAPTEKKTQETPPKSNLRSPDQSHESELSKSSDSLSSMEDLTPEKRSTDRESDKNDEKEEKPEKTRVAGIPKIGLPGMGGIGGGNLLAEMKAKRASMRTKTEDKENRDVKASPISESSPGSSALRPPVKNVIKPHTPESSTKPVPAPRSSSPAAKAGTPISSPEQKDESSASTRAKPPLLRPKPPPVAPKPKPKPAARITNAGSNNNRTSNLETNEEKTKSESPDSDLHKADKDPSKRLSVSERIAKLDKNSNEEQESYKAKSSSLPRQSSPSSDVKEDSPRVRSLDLEHEIDASSDTKQKPLMDLGDAITKQLEDFGRGTAAEKKPQNGAAGDQGQSEGRDEGQGQENQTESSKDDLIPATTGVKPVGDEDEFLVYI